MQGIENVKAILANVGEIAVGGIEIAKDGITLGDLSRFFGILKDTKELIDAVPGSLGEIKDLEPSEVAELAEIGYAVVAEIIDAIREF